MKISFIVATFLLACSVNISSSKDAAQETVSKHGQLSVDGVHLVDKNGERFQLKGMSLFWDIWKPQYYNKVTVDGIRNSCHANLVRAAMATTTADGGYIDNPEESLKRLYAVIDAAIEDDIYVLVDWHDHEGDKHLDSAVKFFNTVSSKYSGVPNIIYETFNEPINQSWSGVLKPYHEAVIKTIRANEPNNIIVLGTPTYSTAIGAPATDPITGYKNIMYTLHFYAGTSDQGLRDAGTRALENGTPIFVTEYGTVNGDGDGPVDAEESRLWWEWLDENMVSHANWAISDKLEGASALKENTPADKVCQEDYLTESGKLVVAHNAA